jgi:hypothetical protein
MSPNSVQLVLNLYDTAVLSVLDNFKSPVLSLLDKVKSPVLSVLDNGAVVRLFDIKLGYCHLRYD